MKFALVLVFVCAAAAAVWPVDTEPNCNNIHDSARQIIAPELTAWSIEPAGTTGDAIDQLDRLKLVWKLHASYGIEHIWGEGADTKLYATNGTSADGFTRVQYSTITPPASLDPNNAACWGTITLEIWLGAIKAWGFVGVQDYVLHQWNLTGSLWINTTRPVYLSDEQTELQVVTVTFPILITVKTQYDIQPTNILVYGTGKVSGSIILFKEWEYPSKVVTIYYLISVQYPYRFITQNSPPLPFASLSGTTNSISTYGNTEMWFYINSVSPTQYCTNVADNAAANWCYQVVHVDYIINDECSLFNNRLVYDGTYRLDLKLGCRDGLSPAWTCEMPTGQAWVYPYLTFSVSSNNICEKFLNYDGTSISGVLSVYPADYTGAWDTATKQTQFVPDNNVWFVVDLSVSSTFAFKMTQLKVLNISFWKDTDPTHTVIYNAGWTTAGNTLSPVLTCDQSTGPTCYLADGLPTAWWKLNLKHDSYLSLYGKVAMKLECVAYIQITYDWAETKTVMFSTQRESNIAPGAEIYMNMPFEVPTTSVASSTGSVTATVVGCVVGGAALLAAVAAFVVFRLRNKNSNFQKQIETTA